MSGHTFTLRDDDTPEPFEAGSPSTPPDQETPVVPDPAPVTEAPSVPEPKAKAAKGRKKSAKSAKAAADDDDDDDDKPQTYEIVHAAVGARMKGEKVTAADLYPIPLGLEGSPLQTAEAARDFNIERLLQAGAISPVDEG